MSAAMLPPWGQLDEFVLKQIDDRPIPEAWRPLGSGNLEQEWEHWLDELVDDLSVYLWPTFDQDEGKWTSPPNEQLIDADFTLLKTLCKQLDEPVRGRAKVATPHRVFFGEEDDKRVVFGANYERYDPAWPEHLRKDKQFTFLLAHGCDRKLGSLHFQLKQKFQRPRPYQMALIQRRRKFSHLTTQLGTHPSFISGHCLQTCVAGMSVYLLFGTSVDFASVDVLKQFTVDVGDRRVFGGVHYPSDNLGSWYTAFKLLPHVVDSAVLPAARAFLWDAIRTKSRVFEAIADHVKDNGVKSPYKKAVDAIAAAAEGLVEPAPELAPCND